MIKNPLQEFPYQTSTIAIFLLASIIALDLMGRVWWCEAGDYSPWSWIVNSRHNSQHLLDPYSFTHILHGILEFWLIGLVFRMLPLAWRFVVAIFIESSWEVVENTNYVINRYREATISLDYYGDSIANSLSDIVCCGIGCLIAYKIGRWWSLPPPAASGTWPPHHSRFRSGSAAGNSSAAPTLPAGGDCCGAR